MHGSKIKHVIDFNRDRSTLKQFSFKTEIKMLDEEWDEFITSDMMHDILDAVCDFEYVFTGSKLKYLTRKNYAFTEAWEDFEKYNSLRLDVMKKTLSELGIKPETYDKAFHIVCRCNALKTKKVDKNGKVIKGDIPNATELIREMLLKE